MCGLQSVSCPRELTVYGLGVPLPLAFWEVTSPTQVTFDYLPTGTEVPHPTIPGLWGPPRVTRRIRFPLGRSMSVLDAREAVSQAYQPGRDNHFMAVVWMWNGGEIQLLFFRSTYREVLDLGDTEPPAWFDIDCVKGRFRSRYELLMDDDD